MDYDSTKGVERVRLGGRMLGQGPINFDHPPPGQLPYARHPLPPPALGNPGGGDTPGSQPNAGGEPSALSSSARGISGIRQFLVRTREEARNWLGGPLTGEFQDLYVDRDGRGITSPAAKEHGSISGGPDSGPGTYAAWDESIQPVLHEHTFDDTAVDEVPSDLRARMQDIRTFHHDATQVFRASNPNVPIEVIDNSTTYNFNIAANLDIIIPDNAVAVKLRYAYYNGGGGSNSLMAFSLDRSINTANAFPAQVSAGSAGNVGIIMLMPNVESPWYFCKNKKNLSICNTLAVTGQYVTVTFYTQA